MPAPDDKKVKEAKFNEKQREIFDKFCETGYVEVEDVETLKKMAPKLEKIYGEFKES